MTQILSKHCYGLPLGLLPPLVQHRQQQRQQPRYARDEPFYGRL